MDFELDSEQLALRDAVRDLLKDAYGSTEARRAIQADDPGFGEKTWTQLAEMGVLGLPFGEDVGGMEAGPVEVGLVAEELGRVIAPEPFVEAVVLAGGLIDAVGTAEQRAELLSGLCDGSSLLAFAHAEPRSRWSASATEVRAERDGDGWRLTGLKTPVVAGGRADVLVVSAATDAGTELFVVDGQATSRESFVTTDGGRAAAITFDGTSARVLGEAGIDRTDAIEAAMARARIAFAREAVGAMARALEITVEYLKTRKQFGVTLSTFQALKFRAADMYVQLELARSMALWGTLVLDAGGDSLDASTRVSAQVATGARHIGQEAVQLHGGIAMTAEYSAGHYLARLLVLGHSLGDRTHHLGRLADTIEGHRWVDPLSYASAQS
ncbi:acyl-CoA dehydrogenase family protein [Mobilicoccus caccae]|uniref:Acyl-CoA dehydrogenase n=1 Tax=Mobilicoccus caccae TaxID=1859295 RepID=A0ABQ6IQZ1_9MICO|nr:acyl-CoA dehydrogenase family protein [Mobilicoccus caccae]GMA40340.1 acyl-CoA dehydrogenase [Mobilicoccus caccae]